MNRFASTLLQPAAAAPVPSVTDASLGLEVDFIPPDNGQSSLDLYVSATGQCVRGYMLDYWRANGAAAVYGNPISDVFVAPNSLYSQAFERGVFQFSPYWMWTDEPAVRLFPLNTWLEEQQEDSVRSDGRRVPGRSDRPELVPAGENPERMAQVESEGGRLSEVTGFSISGPFAAWYDTHEGPFYLGSPISEPFTQRGVFCQRYENATLALDENDVAAPMLLPPALDQMLGFSTAPVERNDRPEYEESIFYSVANPYGVDASPIIGPKFIEVSIANQAMRVYQGGQLVLESLVSTGIEPNHTEVGDFHVRLKYKSQTMAGFTSASGEVVGFEGADGSVFGDTGNPYVVPDVPNVMYFDLDAEALHGCYWHNNFGTPMSHGCVNLPLDVAEWMFQFAPLGTPVTVHSEPFASASTGPARG